MISKYSTNTQDSPLRGEREEKKSYKTVDKKVEIEGLIKVLVEYLK